MKRREVHEEYNSTKHKREREREYFFLFMKTSFSRITRKKKKKKKPAPCGTHTHARTMIIITIPFLLLFFLHYYSYDGLFSLPLRLPREKKDTSSTPQHHNRLSLCFPSRSLSLSFVSLSPFSFSLSLSAVFFAQRRRDGFFYPIISKFQFIRFIRIQFSLFMEY